MHALPISQVHIERNFASHTLVEYTHIRSRYQESTPTYGVYLIA